ncbi:amino acid ABC transporter ATP-binding protein [Salinicola corii]|uniref:Amino acid ABC transporter ATP-binding protein n=1 Tax=Salinicola corii TaxID=2606937 RepID=A0A640WGH4_9GAMM|nr:amino acid ABC transporter ATP-binding protein [Salinicola corii]KAA0019354.1 amino acid ABC transporter ATP-binding protein [Salinicola corii]
MHESMSSLSAASTVGTSNPFPILELIGLRKVFGQQVVLESIDLKVRPGELVCVIGPSGSGKSTMLRCCNRLEEPSGGQVIVDGTDLMDRRTSIDRMRQKIGMVFQQFNLYPHYSALGNVALALRLVKKMSRAQAELTALDALNRVGLGERAGHYPHQLSGGQQQRVGIARAIALGPKIVLFDEPTSALDPELVGSVLEVMRKLRQIGMTMLVVTHEMAFARAVADRVVFMADGHIVEQGPPEQIFQSPIQERTRAFVEQRH